jgi:hypothetical protein
LVPDLGARRSSLNLLDTSRILSWQDFSISTFFVSPAKKTTNSLIMSSYLPTCLAAMQATCSLRVRLPPSFQVPTTVDIAKTFSLFKRKKEKKKKKKEKNRLVKKKHSKVQKTPGKRPPV